MLEVNDIIDECTICGDSDLPNGQFSKDELLCNAFNIPAKDFNYFIVNTEEKMHDYEIDSKTSKDQYKKYKRISKKLNHFKIKNKVFKSGDEVIVRVYRYNYKMSTLPKILIAIFLFMIFSTWYAKYGGYYIGHFK